MCERMSAAELTVDWPLYFAGKRRRQRREQAEDDQRRGRTLG
jgi:hypothetical protein